MRSSLLVVPSAFISFVAGWSMHGSPQDPAATDVPISVAFLVRHAEKELEPADDPALTAAGRERAARLAAIFDYAKVDKVIASNKRRTQETIEPLAKQHGVGVDKVSHDITAEQSADGVRDLLKTCPPGTVSVIAHHSTTMAPILEKLGIAPAEAGTVDTGKFDNLVLVLLPAGQPPQMVRLRYP